MGSSNFLGENYRWRDGDKGGYFIYYSMLNNNEEGYDLMNYSYADKTFIQLTQPKLLFDWGYVTIDADINLLDDGLYHMLIKKEGGNPGIFTPTSEHLTYGWGEPVEDDYVSFEGSKKCEVVFFLIVCIYLIFYSLFLRILILENK